MLKNIFVRYLMRHPFVMDFFKFLLSRRWLSSNVYYQRYMLRNMHKEISLFSLETLSIHIETTLNCNAHCIMCGHSDKEMHGIMTKELFEKIIDDCRKNKIMEVSLSFYGEPLTDPYFFDRVRYLRKYGMWYSFFTNASLLNLDKARMLFELGGLSMINFSVCGYDKKTYEDVMVGLKRDVTYENIAQFLRLKKSYRQENLQVEISTVKTHKNKKDMRKFCAFWLRQKGVSYVITADLWDRVGKKNADEVGLRSSFFKKGNWLMPCRQIWSSLYVYFDGRVSPCCEDGDKREFIIGDMNKQTVKDVYSCAILNDLRALHLSNKRGTHKICGRCYHSLVWI